MSQNIQKFVEGLIDNLKAKGIAVDSAAILQLGKPEAQPDRTSATIPAKGSDQAFKNAITAIASKFGPGAFRGQIPTDAAANMEQDPRNSEGTPEVCTCPNCLTFENFEEVYGKQQPAVFDYAEVTLGGKVFQMKYYKGYYGEQIMTRQKEFSVDPTWTPERIQEEFRLATLNKEYDKAQFLLTTLKNFKN